MSDHKTKRADIASQRLAQLNNQLASTTIHQKKKRAGAPAAPADWSDLLGELNKIRELAQKPRADTTGYRRHKQAGKLWVRERVELLLDKDSFREIGSAAGTVTWAKRPGPHRNVIEAEKEYVDRFIPSNNVQGAGILPSWYFLNISNTK